MMKQPSFKHYFSEEFEGSFGSGVAIGILGTVLLIGLIAVIYHFCNRSKKNNALMEEPTASRSFYA